MKVSLSLLQVCFRELTTRCEFLAKTNWEEDSTQRGSPRLLMVSTHALMVSTHALMVSTCALMLSTHALQNELGVLTGDLCGY